MSWMSSVRLSKTVSSQTQGTDQQWMKSLPSWGKWFQSHRNKPLQNSLHSGGLSSRFYQWRQLNWKKYIYIEKRKIPSESLLCVVMLKCKKWLGFFNLLLPLRLLKSYQCFFGIQIPILPLCFINFPPFYSYSFSKYPSRSVTVIKRKKVCY